MNERSSSPPPPPPPLDMRAGGFTGFLVELDVVVFAEEEERDSRNACEGGGVDPLPPLLPLPLPPLAALPTLARRLLMSLSLSLSLSLESPPPG